MVCVIAAACAAPVAENRETPAATQTPVPAAADLNSNVFATPSAGSIPGTLVRFELIRIPAGTAPDGTPVRAFELLRTEVTWDMYDVFALKLDEKTPGATADARARPSSPYGAPDYGWGHTGYPVMSIAREAAIAFCEWLSSKTGERYRLPTEAEWSHAAALAMPRPDSAALEALAWFRGNAGEQTHAVRRRTPDALGLYDMFGNVAEWVMPADSARVTRGGSYKDPIAAIGPSARSLQTATWNERDPQLPKSRWWLSDGPFVGFRIVREPRN